ncbi:hypothetical protein CO046_05555 [Candidatus Peregrinibacteria bacterium CG_4_9_14_0_2_um_filter_53_11]|nr:MAG: hypothetical protein CO046_05555 [Candidatus Peregrinibacteria bacterium CG_4_9_14_0_2_um_filter_53_11]
MDILLKSLASAGVTALILILAKISGPKLAGALGGIPIVFAISYVILTMQDKGLSREFLIGGIYGAVAGIVFSVLLILLNMYFVKTHWLNFAVAYLACFIFALSVVHLTTK